MTGRRCWQYGRAGCRNNATNVVRLGAHVVNFCNDPKHAPITTKENAR